MLKDGRIWDNNIDFFLAGIMKRIRPLDIAYPWAERIDWIGRRTLWAFATRRCRHDMSLSLFSFSTAAQLQSVEHPKTNLIVRMSRLVKIQQTNDNLIVQSLHYRLTLSRVGGGRSAPPVTYLRIRDCIYIYTLQFFFDNSSFWVWKRGQHFPLIKIAPFSQENIKLVNLTPFS